MVDAISDTKIKQPIKFSFFFWMALAMAFFIFSGFGLTYLQPMATRTGLPLPPIVHLHGVVFFSWILLLVVQPLLVNTGNVKLHRSVGTFGIVIAAMLILMGSLITIMFAGSQIGNRTPDYPNLMYLSVMAVIGFAALFCLAIRNVRTPESHKRLILFATIFLLPPGINRLYMVLFELVNAPVFWTYLTMDMLVVAILIYDWRSLGKISKASMIGASCVVVPHVLHVVLADSGAFLSFYVLLEGLAYYR